MEYIDKVFKVVDNKAELLRDELELVPEFKALLTLGYNKQPGDLDGRRRHRATAEFTYMWFMHSYMTPYYDYSEHERHVESLKAAGLPEGYKISPELKAACDRYTSILSTLTLRIISAARKGAEAMIKYFEDIDFTKTTANGSLVNDPSKFMTSVSKIGELQKEFSRLDESYRQEIQALTGTTGKKNKPVSFLMKSNTNKTGD